MILWIIVIIECGCNSAQTVDNNNSNDSASIESPLDGEVPAATHGKPDIVELPTSDTSKKNK